MKAFALLIVAANLTGTHLCADVASVAPVAHPLDQNQNVASAALPAEDDSLKGTLFRATWPAWLLTPAATPSVENDGSKGATTRETRPSGLPTPILAVPDRKDGSKKRASPEAQPPRSPAPDVVVPDRKDAPTGVLSPERQQAERQFKNFDTNGDGFISLEEYRAGMAAKMSASRAEKVFKEKDRNGDGKLTLDELLSAPTAERPSGSLEETGVPKDNPTTVDGPPTKSPKHSKYGWLYPVSIMAIGYLIFHVFIVAREKF